MLKSWQVNKQSCKVLMTKSQNQSHNHRHKLNRIRAYLTTGSTKNLVETRLFQKKWNKIIINPYAHFYTPRSYTYQLLCILGGSHACGLKALTSYIKNNFSHLTHSQIQAIFSLTQE